MSHTIRRRPWRQQRLFRQGRQLLFKPLPLLAEPVVLDCCGGHCGEEGAPPLWMIRECPTPEEEVAVFYGSFIDGEIVPGWLEQWVHTHVERCRRCGWEWEAIQR